MSERVILVITGDRGAYTISDGALVEVEPVDAIQSRLENVIDDPKSRAEGWTDPTSSARSWKEK